jgi:uncharacterized protein (DUF1499 family)
MKSQNRTGLSNGEFAPCASSPNCVSTQSDQKKKLFPVLEYDRLSEPKQMLKELVLSMERVKLLVEESDYLHFEFTTSIGKFKDDVEFYFPGDKRIIHMKSCSRVGHWDLGANRRRLKKIRRAFKKALAAKQV